MKALGTFAKWLVLFMFGIFLYVWNPEISGRAALALATVALWVASIFHSIEHDKERERLEVIANDLHARIDKVSAVLLERIREMGRD